MPKIICYDTDRKLTSQIVRRFAQSINESGTGWVAESRDLKDFRTNGLPENVDMVCSLGILRGTGLIMKTAASRNVDRLYLDHSYFNSGYNGKSWLRMTINGHTMTHTKFADSARWKNHFKSDNNVLAWKNASQRGDLILVLPPTNAISWYFDVTGWLDKTLAQIKLVVPEDQHHLIKVRQKPLDPIVDKLGNLIGREKHPEDCSLQEDFDNAKVVVSYNSMATIQALRQGIPVICPEHNACTPVSKKIADIMDDVKLDREPQRKNLFFWLSYCQFSEKERTNGTAWHQIRKHQM